MLPNEPCLLISDMLIVASNLRKFDKERVGGFGAAGATVGIQEGENGTVLAGGAVLEPQKLTIVSF